ncbi:MAG: hypothetical protein DMG76_17615 [Acidobacteria bacterium]|nr:MAG: hypothetical protein DMG76_17615 [Acidobacteriota bacterium]
MFMLKKTTFAILLVVATCAISHAQQGESKRPSPAAQAQCKFSGGKTITVNYSSPRMRGRKVFGELVPYGKVWRAGANEATTFITDESLITVEGTNIPAGSYTIFTVPNPDEWTVIINKHTKEWGIPYKYESEELARVPMSVTRLSSPVENFTISFDHTGGSCTMRMSWENTQASVEFTEMNTDLPVIGNNPK